MNGDQHIPEKKILTLRKLTYYIFPISFIIIILFYLINPVFYKEITYEDGIIEWVTFVLLIASGCTSLIIAIRIKKKYKYNHWFFILFFLFNILAGLEEISWGQRVFNIESPGFFKSYNDQEETNLHNTFQGIVRVKTKHVALLFLFIYGVILPLSRKNKKNKNNKILITPPLFLVPAFLIGTLFMIDIPTEQEEEYGELIFSMAFFIFTLYNYQLYKLDFFLSDKKKQSSEIK